MVHEIPTNVRKIFDPHEKHEGSHGTGQAFPVDGALFLVGAFMPRHDSDGRGKIPMRQGNPRIGRRGDGRGNPRNNLERNPVFPQLLGLLTAPPEDIGISPLQPRDPFPLFS